MDWNGGARLELVVRPFSLLLQGARLVVAVGIVGGAAIAIRGSLELLEPMRKTPVLFAAGVLLAVALVAAAIVGSLPTVRQLTAGIPSRCKRLVFLMCRGHTRLSSQASRLCRLVASDFRAVQLLHPSQKEIIQKVFANIKARPDESGGYDAIVAPSGFGKTRCATLLAEALIRDRSLCGLADACLYYDFARGEKVQDLFVRRLGGIAHSGALVIADNFHLAAPAVVEDTTARLLDLSQPLAERHVLLLAQPPGAWRLHGAGEVKLLTEARRQGRLHEIRGLSRSEVDRVQLSPEARRRMQFLFPGASRGLASIAEIHSVQIDHFAPRRDRETAARISAYLFPSGPEAPDWTSPEPLPEVIGTATALSLHHGAFSEGAFRKAYQAVLGGSGPRTWLALMRARGWLRRLARIGLFPRTSLPGRLYVLHETLAEHLRDRLGERDSRFESAFRAALTWRLDIALHGQSPAMQWLGAAELRDSGRLEAHFDAAMVDGNLAAMARRLYANLPHIEDPSAEYQLGVVLDRHGAFADARRHLAKAAAGGAADSLGEAVELALLEAAHGPDRASAVARLRASTRQEIRLSAAYWRFHMDGHAGQFDPDGLTALASEVIDVFEPSLFPGSFILAGLASRVYFDACRHVFLRRERVAQRLETLARLPIVEVLRAVDPSYRAGRLLYECAHVLSFVALAERGVFGRAAGTDELGGVAAESSDLEPLCRQVESAYRNAQDEYAVFGNREQLYLKGDILNARLQNPMIDPREVRLALSEYTDFIVRSGFEDIASYPEIYGFRLALKARQRSLSGVADRMDGFASVDDHDRQARVHLTRIRRMDEACGNRYGQWRVAFYETLFNAITGSRAARRRPPAADLRQSAEEARRHGYIGDAMQIERFLNRGDFSVGQIFNMLLYHPFVHQ